MLARRFLWIVAGLITFVVGGAILYRIFQKDLMKAALVPSASFEEQVRPAGAPDYAAKDAWITRPDFANDPSRWLPAGFTVEAVRPVAAVFFIHPTSYLDRSDWNAPIDHAESQQRARLFVRSQASVFNGVGGVWAPKYRQATFGAFLTTEADAQKALDFAYRDVAAAFDAFVAQVPAERPIILAGHSQGSLHLTRLLRERVAGRPLAGRIVAAYVVGWPISEAADLPGLGLPACERAGQPSCILSWQSFGEPADTEMVTDVFDASAAPDGTERRGTDMLCTNPLTGNRGDAAPAAANRGTLAPNAALTEATVVPGAVPARCGPRGFLLVGENAPDMPAYVLPGNNYHVFDYALFWVNARADVAARLAAFLRR